MNTSPGGSVPSPTVVLETGLAAPPQTNNRRENRSTDFRVSQPPGGTSHRHQSMEVYDCGASDMELRVNNTLFKTHQHLISKFAVLRALITDTKNASQGDPLHVFVQGDKSLGDDFFNMFKILYASVIEGPFEFHHLSLISGLRLATTYDYPALRTFCRHALEKLAWAPIQMVQMGQEFGIASWIECGCLGLSKREKPITQSEATILGIEAFVRVAQAREERQKRLADQAAQKKAEDKPTTSRAKTNTRNTLGSSLDHNRRMSKLILRLTEDAEALDRKLNVTQSKKAI